jgi:hypothetical protein
MLFRNIAGAAPHGSGAQAIMRGACTRHGLEDASAALTGHEKDAACTMEEAVVRMRGAVQAYWQVGESYWLPKA